MLTTPTPLQAYQLYLSTRYLHSELALDLATALVNGLDVPDWQQDYCEEVGQVVYLYSALVTKWVYLVNGKNYYSQDMTGGDDTQFLELYQVVYSLYSNSPLTQTPQAVNLNGTR